LQDELVLLRELLVGEISSVLRCAARDMVSPWRAFAGATRVS